MNPSKTIADSTRYQYEGRLKKIAAKNIKFHEVAEHWATIEQMYPNTQTRKGVITALLWKLKQDHSPAAIAAVAEVQKKFDEIKKVCYQTAQSQELTEKQLANYMTRTDLLTLYNKATSKMDFTSKEYNDDWIYYTLVCLYVIQPPVRADYWGMKIMRLATVGMSEQDIQFQINNRCVRDEEDRLTNWCVVGQNRSWFVFNTYKTANTYGTQIVEAEWLIHHLLIHLNHNLEQWEVVPIGSPNALVKAVKKAFAHFGGKEISIGLLRHSYIVEFYKNNPSIAQKEALAKKMLHSRGVQELYRSENIDEDDS